MGDGDAPKMPFAQRCCGVTFFLVPSVWLLGWVVPHHWKYEESSHLHYLDTWGIGAAVWGAVFALGVMYAVAADPPTPFKDHDLKPPNVPSSRGLDPSDFQDVFEWTWMRLVKVLALFGKLALNITFIGYNFYSLPTRDPDEPLNQAKHAVSWVETGMAGYNGFVTLLIFLRLVACNGSESAFHLRRFLGFLSSWSVLQAISRANPMNVKQELQKRNRVSGFGGALASAAMMLFMFPLAIASVMVKLAQVDFVTDEVYWDWTWWNYLQLGGFINNLAGLGPNMTDERLEAVWQFLELDSRGADPWLKAVCGKLVDHYGFSRAMMYVLTISEVDVYKLLNMNNRKQDSDIEAYQLLELQEPKSGTLIVATTEGSAPENQNLHFEEKVACAPPNCLSQKDAATMTSAKIQQSCCPWPRSSHT